MRVVSGSAKGLRLKTPKGRMVRPTSDKVKSAFFNIIFDYIIEANFLDLFAGTGNMGIEALSRGAQRCTLVDSSNYSISLIKKNLFLANFNDRAVILRGDVFYALKILYGKRELFDIIYIDPPYNFKGEDVLEILWFIFKHEMVRDGGIIGLERYSKSYLVEIEDSPFLLQDKKIYGDTALAIFRPR